MRRVVKNSRVSGLKKDLALVLVFALLIRFVLIPISFHPDLLFEYETTVDLAFHGALTPYVLHHLPWIDPASGRTFLYYPLLTYYLLGSWVWLSGLIIPGFRGWIESLQRASWNPAEPNIPQGGSAAWSLLQGGNIHPYAFLTVLKLPFLAFDIATLYLLIKLVGSDASTKTATAWLLSPILIYGTYMFGGFDVIPTFFVVLSLWLVKEERISTAALALGLGGALKNFPLLLLPFLATIPHLQFRKRLEVLAIGATPTITYLILMAITTGVKSVGLYLFNPYTGSSFIIDTSTKLTLAASILFVIAFVALIAYPLFSRAADRPLHERVFRYWFVALVLIFVIKHAVAGVWTASHFIWFVPFVALSYGYLKQRAHHITQLHLIQVFAVFLAFLLDNPTVGMGLFTPIDLQIGSRLPDLSNSLAALLPDRGLAASLIFTLASAGMLRQFVPQNFAEFLSRKQIFRPKSWVQSLRSLRLITKSVQNG